MVEVHHSLEGKIILLRFVEQDYSGEGSTFLVYRVTEGKLETIRGVMDLPDQVEDWDNEDDKSIEAIRALGVREVYTPIYTPVFFEIHLGVCQESAISHINEKGELENWFEFSTLDSTEWLARDLEQYQIKLRHIDSETGEIFDE